MTNHSAAGFATVEESVAFRVGQHTTEIENLKDANKRLEEGVGKLVEKIDKLLYWILGTLGAAVAGLFVSLFRHN